MLRTAPILLGLLLALPAHAEEPPSDEPMPQAKSAAPAAAATPAPAPAAASAPTPAVAAPAPVAAAPSRVNADGTVEEIIPNPPKKYALAVGGAAVGSLALAAILGGVALGKSSDQNGNTAMPPVYTPDLRDAGSQGRALANTSYVFIGIGLALAVTDVALWYETLRKPRTIRRTPDGTVVSGGK
jgi:hypothetical protein